MKPNTQLRAAVRGFYAWIGSMILMGLAPIVATNLIERASMPARVGGVVLGTLGMVPWMWIVYSVIRRGDEFQRRLHLVALGFAFAGTIVLLAGLQWLVSAKFIQPPDFMVVLVGAIVIWLIAMFGAKSYFEREP